MTFPPGICLKDWHTVDVLIHADQLVLKTEETVSSMDIPPADFKTLKDIWDDPNAYISVGGMAGKQQFPPPYLTSKFSVNFHSHFMLCSGIHLMT